MTNLSFNIAIDDKNITNGIRDRIKSEISDAIRRETNALFRVRHRAEDKKGLLTEKIEEQIIEFISSEELTKLIEDTFRERFDAALNAAIGGIIDRALRKKIITEILKGFGQ